MQAVGEYFDVAHTDAWAAAWAWLSPKLAGRNCIALTGDLGAGKTTFVKTIVAAYESADPVTSPTFSLVQEYQTPTGTIFHFDLYRLESVEEVLALDFETYLDSGLISLVEWPEVAAEVLPKGECLWINIAELPTGGRRLSVL